MRSKILCLVILLALLTGPIACGTKMEPTMPVIATEAEPAASRKAAPDLTATAVVPTPQPGTFSQEQLIEDLGYSQRVEFVKLLDKDIAKQGGLAFASPQQRHTFLRLLENRHTISNATPELNSLSNNSKEYLLAAVAIFSGMVEDDTFEDFCEEVQNNKFLPLPGMVSIIPLVLLPAGR